MKFLLGVVFGVVLVAVGAAAIIYTGSFNTAATVPPSRLEKRIATFARPGGRETGSRSHEPLPATPERCGRG